MTSSPASSNGSYAIQATDLSIYYSDLQAVREEIGRAHV